MRPLHRRLEEGQGELLDRPRYGDQGKHLLNLPLTPNKAAPTRRTGAFSPSVDAPSVSLLQWPLIGQEGKRMI